MNILKAKMKIPTNSNSPAGKQFLRSAVIASFFFALCCLAPQLEVSAVQSDPSSTSPAKKTKVEWTQGESKEIRMGHSGLIQTYRVHRSNQLKKKGESIFQSKVQVRYGGDQQIEIETLGHQLPTPGMNAIQIFSRDLPHRHGVFGGQIVVEMKKVDQDEKVRAIGVFAPNSWIESKNGRVQFTVEKMDLAAPTTTAFWIGVRCREQALSKNELTLVVDEVVKDSAAELAGVEVSDRITRWNRKPLTTVKSLVQTIQANQAAPAKLEIVREGRPVELSIKPLARVATDSRVQTVIVPVAKFSVAEQKIEQVRRLVEVSDQGANRQVRVLLVGPGVNFGNEEIELQVNPEFHTTKANLKQWLDRVAEKKFGMFIEDDSVTVKKATEDKGNADEFEFRYDLGFEPHEILDTIQFGVHDKKFSFEQLAPRMIHRAPGEAVITNGQHAKQSRKLARSLKAGQIVFPSPFSVLQQEELKAKVELLKAENKRVRALNEELKAELQKLRDDSENLDSGSDK